MKPIVMASVLIGCVGFAVSLDAAAAQKSGAQDPATLRRQCAHLVKVKMGIKDTGKSSDLNGVRGAVAMIDQCVANGGKVN